MDCREIRPLLSAYMDNELAPAELRAVQDHVAACPDCAALLASYRRIRAAVRALPEVDPPPALRQAVFARATPAYRRRAALLGLGQQGLAAAALVVTILAVFFTASVIANRGGTRAGNPNGDPATPPRIVSVDPAPSALATAWPPARAVRVTFSKPMDEAATNYAVIPATCPNSPAGATLPPRPDLAWQGTTLLISGLQPDTDYCIRIDPTVARDRYNHPLQDSPLTLIAFRTAELLTAQREPTATAAATATATPTAPTATATPPTRTAAAAATTPAPATMATSAAPGPNPSGQTLPAGPTATPPPPTPTAPRQEAPTEAPRPPTATPTTPPSPSPAPASSATPAAATPAASPAGTATPLPYDVPGGFGLLYSGSQAVRDRLGLPTAGATQVQVSTLQFEHGLMYRRADTKTIYVLFDEQPGVWFSFTDTWADGQPVGGGAGPADGEYLPKRGFGVVWSDNPDFEQRLGYALTPDEQTFTGVIQPFENGTMLWSQGRWIFVLYANGTFERYVDQSK